jgi:hypothetical protein
MPGFEVSGIWLLPLPHLLECWIPADDLPALNASIVGTIEVTAEYP